MFRIHHEMRNQEHPGWFLTLTYDERHVPRLDDGRLSLRFKDVQLFLKTVRKQKFYAKYICVGEYGADTKRPHYHMLLWTDCPVEKLESLWKRGSIHFGRITMESAMYTLKYIIQPKVSQESGLEKTRAQFSKGLGISFLSKAQYEYLTKDYDNPEMFSYIDGRKVGIPRYYRNKIYTKYQMAIQREKLWAVKFWEGRKEIKRLQAKGFKRGIDAYLKSLRIEQAQRIIKSTKYNLTL